MKWTLVSLLLASLLFVFLLIISPASATSLSPQGGYYWTTKAAVRAAFPTKYRAEAMAVVKCETGGTYSPRTVSSNRLYYGIFQAGKWFRSTYGHGRTALAQARAGWRGFKANGYCWTCNRQWPHCGRGHDG